MRNRVFFPQDSLDVWVADDRVDLTSEELTIRGENRRFRVVEAVRVLREITDGSDPNELIGKVKSRAFLSELGAEVMEGSMIIGDNAYDVVPGFVGAPTSAFADHRSENPGKPNVDSDEALLLAFAKNEL